MINLDEQPPVDSTANGADGLLEENGASFPFSVLPASILAACAGGFVALWWHRARRRRAFGAIDGDDAELAMVTPRSARDKKKGKRKKGRARTEETAVADDEIIE